MRKVLLTGSTGFIGSTLSSYLINSGVNLQVILRSKNSGFLNSISEFVVEDLSSLSANDLVAFNEKSGFFIDIDCVIHLAGRAHVVNEHIENPLEEFRKVNKDSTLVLAKFAAENGVKRFVFISSIGVNGNNNLKPFTELDIAGPQEPYAVSKFEAEEGLLKIAKETDMEVVIIRPPLVYGPNAPGNFGSLVKWVNKGVPMPFGAVHNKRSLVALDNLVDFIALCADREKSPKASNQVFLISDGEDVSTTELLQKVAKAFNKKARLLPIPVGLMTFVAKLLVKGDVANRLFGSLQVDSSKARNLLGWKPVITMDEQLKKTAEVYLKENKK